MDIREARKQETVYFMKWLSRLDWLFKKVSDKRNQVSGRSMLCQAGLKELNSTLTPSRYYPHMTTAPYPLVDFVS